MKNRDKKIRTENHETSQTLITDKVLPERRGYFLVKDAIDPRDGKKWNIRISEERAKRACGRSMGQANDVAYILPHVLKSPTAIFQGVRDEGEIEWLCYAGIPAYSFNRHGERDLAREGEVFLVFVNSERVAYNWRWEDADPLDERYPKNYQSRFERKLL